MQLESRIFKTITKGLRHTQYDALATLLSSEHVGKLAENSLSNASIGLK